MRPETTPEKEIESLGDSRDVLRQRLIQRRLALPAETCARLSETVSDQLLRNFPQLARMRVGFCWPVKNEPDLRPLMMSWITSGQPGFAALLPVVVDAEAPLAFRPWIPDNLLTPDRYGIPTPAEGEFVTPEAILIPVNGFDSAGYRIGYGGGFFDRTLAALNPSPLSIGVGFELSRVDSIYPEAHDVRLDAMVTETGVFFSQRN